MRQQCTKWWEEKKEMEEGNVLKRKKKGKRRWNGMDEKEG